MDLLDGQNGPPQPVERRPRRAGGSSAEVIVHVVGEIDICTEPALTRCLAAQLQPTRHLTSLVVDLSSVTYVGVRGFAALLTAATNATTATSRSAWAATARRFFDTSPSSTRTTP